MHGLDGGAYEARLGMQIGVIGGHALSKGGGQETVISREEDWGREIRLSQRLADNESRGKLHCIVSAQGMAIQQLSGKVNDRHLEFDKVIAGQTILTKRIQSIDVILR